MTQQEWHFASLGREFSSRHIALRNFPLPKEHIFVHSVHSGSYRCSSLDQHSLLRGHDQTVCGYIAHMESPSGNIVNDIHDHPKAQQLEVKGGDSRPKLGLDLTAGAS